MENSKFKVVVIGGTGLIGSRLVTKLADHGFDAVAASPDTGVNTITGEGLAHVLEGARVVVDVSNSPSFEEKAATDFFTTSTNNLLKAEKAAGVEHHVALSVVGTDILAKKDGIGGYFRAKLAQENLIRNSSVPYSIVHATQFFEFAKAIADSATEGATVRLPAAPIQPMAADDVAAALCTVAEGPPISGTVEVAGPEVMGLDDFVRAGLSARDDPRTVVTDAGAGYFGAAVDDTTLIPNGPAKTAPTRLGDWLIKSRIGVSAKPDKAERSGMVAGSARSV